MIEIDAKPFYRWTRVRREFQSVMCLRGVVLRWIILRVEP